MLDNALHPEFDAYAEEAVNRGHIEDVLSLDAYRRDRYDIDCTPKEASQYWYHILDLIYWALHGYPLERRLRDERWLAAR